MHDRRYTKASQSFGAEVNYVL